MRKILLTLGVVCLTLSGYSQNGAVKEINNLVTEHAALEPLHFLASDKLMGRSPKRPEIVVAANYIRDQLKSFGAKDMEGAKNYFQSFELNMVTPAKKGSMNIKDSSFQIGTSLVQLGGNDAALSAPVIFAGFGTPEDLEKLDLKGKIVVTNFGINDSSKVGESIQHFKVKEAAVRSKGAIALVERFWQTDAAWGSLMGYFLRDRIAQGAIDSIPVYLVNADVSLIKLVADAPQATLNSSGNSVNKMAATNVIGWVEGSDPKLKSEYIVLSAHYDHIGVTTQPKMVDGKMDSIYNGARDNAVGVTAVMNAARYFAKQPAKRSVMFVLYTAEEMGLLGSRYFSDNSPVPLNKIVYNLNCDNGGYNDTSIVTVIGLGRTSADDDIKKAAKAYGVKATADPVPELNLFDRSDNLNLAIKGVPAPTFGMGITGFDSVIQQYYHQVADEVSTFNLRYALVYVRSYILAARNIANNKTRPTWIKNDKYEAAWKKLYGSTE